MVVASRWGSAVNCAHDRPVRPARLVRNTRSASPVVHGFQNCLECPRAPRRPLRPRRGPAAVACDQFFGSACVTERSACLETRYKTSSMRPSSAERA